MLVYRPWQCIMKDCCRIELIASDVPACMKWTCRIMKFGFIFARGEVWDMLLLLL